MLDLNNQVAIVTGAGSGIGRGIALALAQEGVKVTVCGRRPDPLAATVSQMQGRGLAISDDVSLADEVQNVVETTVEQFGPVDILVNNAGIGGGDYIHQHDIDTWDRIMATNLRGPFLFARAVLPMMRQRGKGHIINISSESGFEYYRGSGAYGVSKHALNALSEYIQRENQAEGIRVDTICPGMVVTEMSRGRPGLNHDKCLWPDDIADLALWLLTRRPNIKIGRPILIQTMENPWE